ncbi:hypothetical protein ACRAWD_24885 [Caulobacter segnis]
MTKQSLEAMLERLREASGVAADANPPACREHRHPVMVTANLPPFSAPAPRLGRHGLGAERDARACWAAPCAQR